VLFAGAALFSSAVDDSVQGYLRGPMAPPMPGVERGQFSGPGQMPFGDAVSRSNPYRRGGGGRPYGPMSNPYRGAPYDRFGGQSGAGGDPERSSDRLGPGAPGPRYGEQYGGASGWDRYTAHRFGGSSVFNRGGPLYDRSSTQYGSTYGTRPSNPNGGQYNRYGAPYDEQNDRARTARTPTYEEYRQKYSDGAPPSRSSSGDGAYNQFGGPFDGPPGQASGWDRYRAHRFGGSNLHNRGGPLYDRSDDQYGSTYGEAPPYNQFGGPFERPSAAQEDGPVQHQTKRYDEAPKAAEESTEARAGSKEE